MTDDSKLFDDDDSQTADIHEIQAFEPWNILIVDDEEEIHRVTTLVLRNMEVDKRPLHFLHAYSAKEAKDIFRENNAIAMALVDVVMETDHAGLDLVDWIRNEADNHKVRLILRTGQPGQAPEQQVIEKYDINDYKDKTELTNIKLKTLMYSTLRSYRDILTIERGRQGLARVLESTSTIYQNFCVTSFASAILEQINNVLNYNRDSIYAKPVKSALAASLYENETDFEIIASSGEISHHLNAEQSQPLPADIRDGFNCVHKARKSMYINNCFYGYFVTKQNTEHLLYVCPGSDISPEELNLLEIYSQNVGIALDNRNLHKEIEDTQKEFVYRLGEAVEKRSKETGAHVHRVAKICELLAIKLGCDLVFTTNLKLAAPLHDIGKIGIPDAILNKPGPLTPDEWEIMRTHATIGHDILGDSNRPILQLAAKIAEEHHENWDGSGYPRGLKGTEICLAGRITSLADVFDAMGNRRCYKDPWPEEKIVEEVKKLSGKKFDPTLVNILLANLSEFSAIREMYPDE